MEVGETIADRYRLQRRLACGGMGEVWAARNELTNREFAIKFLLKEFSQNDDAFQRFVREAETTGKLRHPSIVDVFDVAQMPGGRPFIVMELLHGEGLDDRLRREGKLSSFDTAAFFAQLSMALAEAHRAGVIHRDLSASNVYLAKGPDGIVPKILDFGVSKNLAPSRRGDFKTVHGTVLGNPVYMSPEQARGAEQVDARTDVWSLGVLMYQCLSGRRPYEARNYNALVVRIMTQPHVPLAQAAPEADPELCALVEDCLVKDRAQRTRSARDLADRLSATTRRLAQERGSQAPGLRRRATDRLPAPAESSASRGRGFDRWVPAGMSYGRVASLAGLVGLAVGALVVWGLLGRLRTQPSQVREVQEALRTGALSDRPLGSGASEPAGRVGAGEGDRRRESGQRTVAARPKVDH